MLNQGEKLDMTDFPAFLVNTPCVVIGSTLPAGTYDKDGNCVIKVPRELVRPDGILEPKPKK